MCNSLNSTSLTALASFYVSDRGWYSMGEFKCNRGVTPTDDSKAVRLIVFVLK